MTVVLSSLCFGTILAAPESVAPLSAPRRARARGERLAGIRYPSAARPTDVAETSAPVGAEGELPDLERRLPDPVDEDPLAAEAARTESSVASSGTGAQDTDGTDESEASDGAGAAGEADAGEDEDEDDDEDEVDGILLGDLLLTGALDQRYRFRKRGSEEDQDLYGYLTLDAEHPLGESSGRRSYRKLVFHIDAHYDLDIDGYERIGDAGGVANVPFAGASDTFDDRFQPFLETLWLEARRVAILDRLRLGRQFIHREEAILFDGGFLRTEKWRGWSFDLYGGLPAHHYEDSSSGDGFVGASLDFEPVRGLVVGADHYWLRDRREDGPDTNDHVTIARGRWRLGREWTFRGSASWDGTRDRRQLIEARYLSEAIGFLASARVVRQNGIVDFQSSEISPYVLIEGTLAPYWQGQLDLSQPIGDHFGVGGGFLVRELENPDDAGTFNHSFRNGYLSLECQDLWTGFRASLRGDLWDADGEDIYSVGFELSQEILEIVRVRAGTSYALYRFDYFTGEERNRDRIYYGRLRWHLAEGLDLDTDYQYEKDSTTEYHTVIGGLRLWF